MTLELLKDVEAEIAAYAEWDEARREGLGEDFLAEVDRSLTAIAELPLTWPLRPLPRARKIGERHVTLDRFPFSVAYVA